MPLSAFSTSFLSSGSSTYRARTTANASPNLSSATKADFMSVSSAPCASGSAASPAATPAAMPRAVSVQCFILCLRLPWAVNAMVSVCFGALGRHRTDRHFPVQQVQRVRKFEIVVFLAGCRTDDVAFLLRRAFLRQMAGKFRFAQMLDLRLVVLVALRDRHIGRDTGCLNRVSGRRVVARRGEPERATAFTQRNDRLHGAFAERRQPFDRRALVVLKRSGHDFRRRSRATIDQNHDGLAVGDVAALGGIMLRVLGMTAARGDDFAAVEEVAGDGNRLVEQAAGIV